MPTASIGVRDGLAQLADEAEVEEDHAPRRGDQDVRGLDVAVQLARGVQGADALSAAAAAPGGGAPSGPGRGWRRAARSGCRESGSSDPEPKPESDEDPARRNASICGVVGDEKPLDPLDPPEDPTPRTWSRKATPSMSSMVKNHCSPSASSS